MRRPTAALALLAVVGCGPGEPREVATPLAAIGGFRGPEAVRFDPEQQVWFVGNFGSDDPEALDNDGFISRLGADGASDEPGFVQGGVRGVTLHGPRGMALQGDTLWVVDQDAVRGFDRRTGVPVAVVDFTAVAPGFLNDIVVGGDGMLYVTDTGKQRIHRISGRAIDMLLEDDDLGGPNGIAWEAGAGAGGDAGRFLIGPYYEGRRLLAWRPGGRIESAGAGTGSGYDGVEVIGPDSVLVASQGDSSLQLFTGGAGRRWIGLRGRPADLGWDAARRVVAVPYVGRDTVELFRLP